MVNLVVALRALSRTNSNAHRRRDKPSGGPAVAKPTATSDALPALDLGVVARAAVRVATATLVEVVLGMLLLNLSFFGVAHIAWLDLSVVVPVAAGYTLLGRPSGRRLTPWARAAALLGLGMIPIAIKALVLDPYDLQVEHTVVSLPAERDGADSFTVGVLADLQATRIGEHERESVRLLMAEAPDLILIPGDLFQGPSSEFEQQLPHFQELLRQLDAPGGVWVVSGNSDYLDGLPRLLEGSSARLLDDEVVHVQIRDRRVALFGAAERGRRGFQQKLQQLTRFQSNFDDGEVRIVFSHRPGLVNALAPDSRVDLLVAGHTHGGQVSFPFIGPPIVLSPLPRKIAAGGLHTFNGNRLYVSRGVGMERLQAPRVRFGVLPEVSVLHFQSPPR